MASYQLYLENPVTLSDLIKDVVALADRVQMAMINHKAVPLDTPVGPGDRVALFPIEYPLFVDWRGFRV
jgi:molybdopterin converting factor small subunit